MNYPEFIQEFDKRLLLYFEQQKNYIHCTAGCSLCCEKGDYPMTAVELEYLMQGFIQLDDEVKQQVQHNFKTMKPGESCPFLINKLCSVYQFRPIICRTHGLAYVYKDNKVKIPYCANYGKNFAEIDKDGEIFIALIKENLDTQKILQNQEIRNLYDWINHKSV